MSQTVSEYVSLKGTRAGILLVIREECPFEFALKHVHEVVLAQAELLKNSPISVDLGWREVSEADQEALCATLQGLGLSLLGVISTSLATRRLFEAKGYKAIIGALGLAKHGGRARKHAAENGADGEGGPLGPAEGDELGEDSEPAPDPFAGSEPTLYVRKNLRSGQRVEFPGHVVVFGDVNHGAEISAGGDVVVLGHVRGTVHAGCNGEEDARVVALNLHAPQVRIAGHLGLVEARKQHQGNQAVAARVTGGKVITSLLGG